MADSTVEAQSYGCSHYKRKCEFLCPCCDHIYTCRFCHNDSESHALDRTQVIQIICLECKTPQEVSQTCCSCGIVFGNYFCAKCRLFDDEDKRQFHCDSCGICRVGGRDKFFHCVKCDICLPIKIKDTHKCVEKASQSSCPVCLEDLHTSRVPSHVPSCGHLIHRTCFEEMIQNSNYACPLCSVSMVNMTHVWKRLDEEVSHTPMPPAYARRQVGILCRDCHKESMTKFHVIGLKCTLCGSYNTCRANGMTDASPAPSSTKLVTDVSTVRLLVTGLSGAETDFSGKSVSTQHSESTSTACSPIKIWQSSDAISESDSNPTELYLENGTTSSQNQLQSI